MTESELPDLLPPRFDPRTGGLTTAMPDEVIRRVIEVGDKKFYLVTFAEAKDAHAKTSCGFNFDKENDGYLIPVEAGDAAAKMDEAPLQVSVDRVFAVKCSAGICKKNNGGVIAMFSIRAQADTFRGEHRKWHARHQSRIDDILAKAATDGNISFAEADLVTGQADRVFVPTSEVDQEVRETGGFDLVTHQAILEPTGVLIHSVCGGVVENFENRAWCPKCSGQAEEAPENG